jgi:hypothetical protein
MEVVRKRAVQLGFAVLPRRCVVERTYSWVLALPTPGTRLRTAAASPEAFVKWAMVCLMPKRLAHDPVLTRAAARCYGSVRIRFREPF